MSLTCSCPVSPIVRFINFKTIEGTNVVYLDQFKDKLCDTDLLNTLNSCLTKHGFHGSVNAIDNEIAYIQEGDNK